MPAKSAAQYKFMQGIAYGMKPKSGKGPGKSVAEEFVKKTPKGLRKAYSKKG